MYDIGNNQREREAWLRRVLGAIPPGARILDAGAGELKYKSLCAHLEYVSQDFGKYDGRGDSTGLQTGTWDQTRLDIVSDITQIPEPDASFDAIMCIEVLEHLPEPRLAIAEFTRLLKPGGSLILTAPFCSLTHFAPYHFSSGYNRYYYEHHLAADFDIVELAANGSYFAYLAQELTRLPSMERKYAGGSGVGQLIKSEVRRAALRLLIDWVNEAATRDRGSSELLCFGYHVVAAKR